jgi:hypothetical protein
VLVQEIFSALAALLGPVQIIFFLTVHSFNSFVPIAQQARQAAVLGRLSVSMCLCSKLSASSVQIFLNMYFYLGKSLLS